MVSQHHTAPVAALQNPPVVAELRAVFNTLPDESLIDALRGGVRRGPKGHAPAILWRCYITYYYLGVESVSALVRLLHDNPFIASACGIESPDEIPSQPTFSRFGTKLARAKYSLAVKNVLRKLTRSMHETLPDFGKSVAIDATDIKAWSRVPGSGVRGRGSGERETTASSLAGKEESSRNEDNSGQGKDGPAGAIAQGGNGR